MIFERLPEHFDALVIKNTFTEDQLGDIWKEIDFLTREDVMQDPEHTGSALDEDGNPVKKNYGVWLKKVFNDLESSSIYSNSRNVLFSEDVIESLQSLNPLHVMYKSINDANMLLSYYEGGDGYDMHTDASAYTATTYLFREPRRFSGGEIVFQNEGVAYEQDIENNMTIIFPSAWWHKVNTVLMEEDDQLSGDGRYCLSTFFFINSSND
jgi:Rps23 Pro-64 3,4-dihydroxylase Tpa1-like proline 4-hydroxylase